MSKHLLAEFRNEPLFFGQRNEHVRRDPAVLLIMPASQRFGRNHLSTHRIDDWLIKSGDTLFGDCGRKPKEQIRSEEHTSELQSRSDLVCRLLLEKKKKKKNTSVSETDKYVQ